LSRMAAMAEWRWVQCFADQLRWCGLTEGEVVAVLSESSSRPELVETARLAAESLGGRVFDLVVPTPANDQPVAIRSTGASQALHDHPRWGRRSARRRAGGRSRSADVVRYRTIWPSARP